MAVGFLHNRKVFGGGTAPEPVEEKDVCFWDYDATLLHSYTIAEANALSALPALPTRDGLTCQGWNHTLAQVQAADVTLDVGATYITDDGKTRAYITLDAPGRLTVQLCWTQDVSNGVTIDWGDNSATVTVAGTTTSGLDALDPSTWTPADPAPFVTASHIYASFGDYTITMTPAAGCTLGLGAGTYDSAYTPWTLVGGNKPAHALALRSLHIGNALLNMSALGGCHNLEYINLPYGTDFNYAYGGNKRLKCLILPSSITSINQSAFVESQKLSIVSLPQSITEIADTAFNGCSALRRCALPSGLETLGEAAFNDIAIEKVVYPATLSSVGSYPLSSEYLRYAKIKTSIISSGMLTGAAMVQVVFSSAIESLTGYGVMPAAAQFDFSACTQVPTLESTDVFHTIAADCKMLIPSALYATWSTETNWSAFASYMVSV